MSPTAIIAGQGRLPVLLAGHLAAAGTPARILALDGFPPEAPGAESFRLEHLGTALKSLRDGGTSDVVCAGAVRRPAIDPARIDALTAPLVPRIAAAMGQGDDFLLRTIIAIFEEAGLRVLGAHQVMPGLTLPAGPCTRTPPAPGWDADLARARAILEALGPLDLSQSCVVAGGLCLGIETQQGTEALLRFVAETRAPVRPGPGGVLVKRSKPGQDPRIDMPAIGPETIDQAVAAGLVGIEVQAGGVLMLDAAEARRRADAAGLAVWGRA
jgi:DUF1009 family protein